MLRFSMLIQGAQGLFESDGFYYYAAIQATIQNGSTIPNPLPLSGFPIHQAFGEFPGLVYVVVVPYYILGGNVPALALMYMMPVIFGLLGIYLCFELSKRLFKNERIGLIAAFFFAVLPVAFYRTMALQFRGESFVPILFAAFILLNTSKDKNLRCLSWILIPICVVFWKAGAYVIGIVVIAYFLKWIYYKDKAGFYTSIIIFMGGIWFSLPTIMPAILNLSSGILQTTLEAAPLTFTSLMDYFNYAAILTPIGVLFALKAKFAKSVDMIWFYLLGTLVLGVPMMIYMVRWIFLVPIPVAIFSAYGIYQIFKWLQEREIRVTWLHLTILLMSCLAISSYIAFSVYPIDNAPQLLQAMIWVRASTPTNATFLSSWDSSSQIEGWGERQAYTDSVSQNNTRDVAFANFLMQRAGNYSYLEQVNPDYLLLRRFWANNSQVIAQEGNITDNYNGSNLQAFENGNVPFQLAYNNSDVLIYEVSKP
jgi:asparagine N-glycosylation enzyme membrane subunit Stt3